MKNTIMSIIAVCVMACAATVLATPVAVEWSGSGEKSPTAVARPFAGFLPDGRFLVAGGSYFDGDVKKYSADVNIREQDGTWKRFGEMRRTVAEGVSCVVEIDKKGFVFCAGGTDGQSAFSDAFALSFSGEIGQPGSTLHTQGLPALPEPVVMGAAAADGETVYVVSSSKVFRLRIEIGRAHV